MPKPSNGRLAESTLNHVADVRGDLGILDMPSRRGLASLGGSGAPPTALRFIREPDQCAETGFVMLYGAVGPESLPTVPMIAEVYPALWSGRFPLAGASPDQQDAYTVAAWLRASDVNRKLHKALTPPLSDPDRATTRAEG